LVEIRLEANHLPFGTLRFIGRNIKTQVLPHESFPGFKRHKVAPYADGIAALFDDSGGLVVREGQYTGSPLLDSQGAVFEHFFFLVPDDVLFLQFQDQKKLAGLKPIPGAFIDVDGIPIGEDLPFRRPFRIDDLEAALDKVSSPSTLPLDHSGLRINSTKDFIIGQSLPMKKIFEKILKVAPTDSTVLISGESGTGKELVARAIHANSNRKEREFVAVDCSSLVETLLESELFGHVKGSFTGAHQTKHGLFELANHGTFFFDEISNLTLNIQAKLLRVIQEREFMKVGDQKKIKLDIRIISASNKNLVKSIHSGDFREDLYYRLSVVPIHLPPLRNRVEDIPPLIEHFLNKFSKKIKRSVPEVSNEAMEVLKEYPWPGNVRELEHTVERILILEDTDVIRVRDLPSFISQRQGEIQMLPEEPLSLKELEKKYIRFILQRTKGKKTQAANILGINRKTLGMKIKKYGLYF